MQSALAPRSKLPDVGTTIFSVIGKLAAEHDALNLSQGAPNFAPDPALVEGVARAMRDGHNQYAPMPGLLALREALALKTESLGGARYDPGSEITVLASASEGLYAAISALVHPGDEVIYFEPSFDSYAPIVRMQGAVPVAIKLSPETFRIDWDEVAAALTPRTRMDHRQHPAQPHRHHFRRRRSRAARAAHARHRHRDPVRRGLRARGVRRRAPPRHGEPPGAGRGAA